MGYTLAMKACALRGDVESVDWLLQRWVDNGETPTHCMMSSAVEACARVGDTSWAEYYVSSMLYSRLDPGLLGHSFVSACRRGNGTEAATCLGDIRRAFQQE